MQRLRSQTFGSLQQTKCLVKNWSLSIGFLLLKVQSFPLDLVGLHAIHRVHMLYEVGEAGKLGAWTRRNARTAEECDSAAVQLIHEMNRNVRPVSYKFRHGATRPRSLSVGWRIVPKRCFKQDHGVHTPAHTQSGSTRQPFARLTGPSLVSNRSAATCGLPWTPPSRSATHVRQPGSDAGYSAAGGGASARPRPGANDAALRARQRPGRRGRHRAHRRGDGGSHERINRSAGSYAMKATVRGRCRGVRLWAGKGNRMARLARHRSPHGYAELRHADRMRRFKGDRANIGLILLGSTTRRPPTPSRL